MVMMVVQYILPVSGIRTSMNWSNPILKLLILLVFGKETHNLSMHDVKKYTWLVLKLLPNDFFLSWVVLL